MTMNLKTLATLLILLFPAAVTVVHAQESQKEYGVYEYVLRNIQGGFQQSAANLDSSVTKAGWRLLAQVDAGVPENCTYKARVFVIVDTLYAKKLMQINPKTAPFAVIDRINLFEDEQGLHVSVVNPRSILRTVLMDDTAYTSIAQNHLQALRSLVTSAIQGQESRKQYGEIRDQGFIGKTMGVMAGGPFNDKVEDAFVIANGSWLAVAAKAEAGLQKPGPQWGLHQVFRLDLPEFKTVIFGSTGAAMESKSFSIVKEGSDDTRSDLKFPGLAHAGAYPFEVVVAGDGSSVKIRTVESMYRMKMYFEDAGKWAFMKNMGMPGSIADEINNQLKPVLENK